MLCYANRDLLTLKLLKLPILHYWFSFRDYERYKQKIPSPILKTSKKRRKIKAKPQLDKNVFENSHQSTLQNKAPEEAATDGHDLR